MKQIMTDRYSRKSKAAIAARHNLTTDPGSDLTHLTTDRIASYLQSSPHVPSPFTPDLFDAFAQLSDTSATMDIKAFNATMCRNMDILIKREMLS